MGIRACTFGGVQNFARFIDSGSHIGGTEHDLFGTPFDGLIENGQIGGERDIDKNFRTVGFGEFPLIVRLGDFGGLGHHCHTRFWFLRSGNAHKCLHGSRE